MDNCESEPKFYKLRKCDSCGNEFKSTLGVTRRQFCKDCMEKRNKYFDELSKEHLRIKTLIMHETALRKLETCHNSFIFSDLQESIDAIEEMEKMSPESFLSASEVLVAIGLYYNAYFFKINYKVGNHKVDFYMPEEKIVLEIDSGLHDIGEKRYHDGKKDIEIRSLLGPEWEVVRFNNTYTDKFPLNVGDKAVEVAEKQRGLRKKNHGMLPRGYSKSVDAYYNKVFG